MTPTSPRQQLRRAHGSLSQDLLASCLVVPTPGKLSSASEAGAQSRRRVQTSSAELAPPPEGRRSRSWRGLRRYRIPKCPSAPS